VGRREPFEVRRAGFPWAFVDSAPAFGVATAFAGPAGFTFARVAGVAGAFAFGFALLRGAGFALAFCFAGFFGPALPELFFPGLVFLVAMAPTSIFLVLQGRNFSGCFSFSGRYLSMT
jgi:hypothetical protein